jgi:hypothetical protein
MNLIMPNSLKSTVFLLLSSLSCSPLAETIFTYKSLESNGDVRFQYEYRLLSLALEKSISQYGQYSLQSSPRMNTSRTLKSLTDGSYDNFFVLLSYKHAYSKTMSYVPIPAQRGIVGYRLFITSKDTQPKLNQVTSLDMLKQLTFVQGKSWLDVQILRDNGFDVKTSSTYSSLFDITSKNFADIFLEEYIK